MSTKPRTEAGKALLAQLPHMMEGRPYAVTFTDDILAIEQQAEAERSAGAALLDVETLAEAMWGHQPADLRDTNTGSLHCGRECAEAIAAQLRLTDGPDR